MNTKKIFLIMLISLLEAELITLLAKIDEIDYIFTPSRYFLNLKNDFLMSILY